MAWVKASASAPVHGILMSRLTFLLRIITLNYYSFSFVDIGSVIVNYVVVVSNDRV